MEDKKIKRHNYGSRTLWTALAILIIIVIGVLIASSNKPEASRRIDGSSFADSPYYPTGTYNVPFVGVGIQGAIKLTAGQTDADLEDALLKLYRLEPNGSLQPVSNVGEERFRPRENTLPTVDGNNRAFTHASSLRKGGVYRIVLFEKGQNIKERARNCTYTDFQIPWVYQRPLITFTSSLRAGSGEQGTSDQSASFPLEPIDLNCTSNPTPLVREPRPTVAASTVTGQLALHFIYNNYYLSGAISSSDIDNKIYVIPNGNRVGLDTRRPAVRKALACISNASKTIAGPGSRPRVTLSGKYQIVNGSSSDGADLFIVNSIQVADANIASRCTAEIAAANRTTSADDES